MRLLSFLLLSTAFLAPAVRTAAAEAAPANSLPPKPVIQPVWEVGSPGTELEFAL